MKNHSNLDILDNQMTKWGTKLRDDIGIPHQFSKSLATTVASEILALSGESKQRIIESSPIQIQKRLDELVSFQGWMDYAHTIQNNPYVVRAQVITEIYVCFVYLGESWFKVIRQEVDSQSTTKKCCKFLTDNPIRAFRNAIAHANWQYNSDFSGLEFWARKGQDNDEPMSRFDVSNRDLAFWQCFARCVAYASFLSLGHY
jgi:hypothetical protein